MDTSYLFKRKSFRPSISLSSSSPHLSLSNSISIAMASSNQVKIIEVCRIKPTPMPETVGDSYLPLTFFDAIWTRFPPTQRVFFYEIQRLSPDLFYTTILPSLKNSLSITLHHYPPLAGNLTWHPVTAKPVIRYSPDDAVFLTVAESGDDFYSLSTDGLKEAKVLHALLPSLKASESEAEVLTIQITLFPGYGFSIGYSANHASMDGRSSAMFLNSWAATCRLGSHPSELTPVMERSLIDDPLDICTTIMVDWGKITGGMARSFVPLDITPGPGLFRRTFRLNPDQIREIKEKIKINSHVSTFTAVCSYVWTCLVKTEEGDLTKENVYLGINIDCRSRLEPQVPGNYFGNCVNVKVLKVKVESLVGDDGIAAAAIAIRDTIEGLKDGVSKGMEKFIVDGFDVALNEKLYGIAGSMWFKLYDLDFGWGRPSKVEMVSIDKSPAFSLCDGRDGDGTIEIGIVMTLPKLQAFAPIFNNVVC